MELLLRSRNRSRSCVIWTARGCALLHPLVSFLNSLLKTVFFLFVQVGAEINATTKHELIHSVRFPLTEDARLGIERFTQYAATRVNYVQLVQYTFSLHSICQFNCNKCESGLVSSPFSAGARSRQGAHPTGEVGEHRSGGAARAGAHRQRALPPVPLRPLARGPAAPLDLCALLCSALLSSHLVSPESQSHYSYTIYSLLFCCSCA